MTHTAKYMVPAIGKRILVQVEHYKIPMRVIDVKSAWGKVRLEVEPILGTGRAWIEMDRVQCILDDGDETYQREDPRQERRLSDVRGR